MGSFVAGLDATVVNVALPAIEEELGGGLAGQQWVSNGYLLALGSLILIGGSLGDVLGERRVFSIGVAGFGVASLLCALAPSIEVLVAGRVLQGIFGALLAPSSLAVIVAAFPPQERGAAIGSWTAWAGIATVIGPFLGGWLIETASWRWIFALNVPFVLLTLALVKIAEDDVQEAHDRQRDGERDRVDEAARDAGGLEGFLDEVSDRRLAEVAEPERADRDPELRCGHHQRDVLHRPQRSFRRAASGPRARLDRRALRGDERELSSDEEGVRREQQDGCGDRRPGAHWASRPSSCCGRGRLRSRTRSMRSPSIVLTVSVTRCGWRSSSTVSSSTPSPFCAIRPSRKPTRPASVSYSSSSGSATPREDQQDLEHALLSVPRDRGYASCCFATSPRGRARPARAGP